jgi:hypothetical protein
MKLYLSKISNITKKEIQNFVTAKGESLFEHYYYYYAYSPKDNSFNILLSSENNTKLFLPFFYPEKKFYLKEGDIFHTFFNFDYFIEPQQPQDAINIETTDLSKYELIKKQRLNSSLNKKKYIPFLMIYFFIISVLCFQVIVNSNKIESEIDQQKKIAIHKNVLSERKKIEMQNKKNLIDKITVLKEQYVGYLGDNGIISQIKIDKKNAEIKIRIKESKKMYEIADRINGTLNESEQLVTKTINIEAI